VKDRLESSSEAITTKLVRREVLHCEAENDLTERCLVMERKFFGLTVARRHASHLTTCCKKRN
jgi:hypothetical protein